MNRWASFIMVLLLLSACGFYQLNGFDQEENNRRVASLGAAQLAVSDEEAFLDELEEKLISLHSYYLIGAKHLENFDSQIKESTIEKIYESGPYLKLIAVRTQTEEIEKELSQVWEDLSVSKSIETKTIKDKMVERIRAYSKKSPHAQLALENLSSQLGIELKQDKNKVDLHKTTDLAGEFKEFSKRNEFAVYEKNIEHLSYMLEFDIKENNKRFIPSAGKQGNVSGYEFPEKVWALTFDDGPGRQNTKSVLKHLKNQKMKANFFLLTQNVKKNPDIAKEIQNAGMDIGAHSYTHKQLTKVGALTLEKEISLATNELANFLGKKIDFFRLPYGAGLNSVPVREKIAENNLLHVFWTIDTVDWMPQPSDQIVQRAISLMKKSSRDSGIVLLHDIHSRSAEASLEIMKYLRTNERRVCTIKEIVTQINEGAAKVCP
jgi:peptidoglycan/xylan/chitin deacetylase (PgdA/CDA1 family)